MGSRWKEEDVKSGRGHRDVIWASPGRAGAGSGPEWGRDRKDLRGLLSLTHLMVVTFDIEIELCQPTFFNSASKFFF